MSSISSAPSSRKPRVPPVIIGRGLVLIEAPWRHEYFDGAKEKGCFICRAVKDRPPNDRKNLLLLRARRSVIILNRFPYTMGALMIAPMEHIARLGGVGDETKLELMNLLTFGMEILDRALKPKGYNIGINQGLEAGAGLDNHLHIHIVPRWGADTNFMTTIASTRVLAESTNSMFRRLTRAMKEIQNPRRNISKGKRA